MNTGSSKIKKVYHLRKTVSSLKPQEKQTQNQAIKQDTTLNRALDEKKQQVNNNSFVQSANNSFVRQNIRPTFGQDMINNYTPIINGSQLTVDRLIINFQQKLDCIQTRQIKVKNIGSSAVYYQWVFKNQQKLNQFAVKDLKPHFFCHYNGNMIKPGEQISFYFSFISQIPGYFSQECEIRCQPTLITKIPFIKLQGKAYIDDKWKTDRELFLKELQQSTRLCSVNEVLSDTIDQIKLPQPQKPDVKDIKIAEQLFEAKNQNLHLYFNPYLHKWFNQLFQQIWAKSQNKNQQPYWDQSVQTIRSMIQGNQLFDEVQKICFLQRLQHYTYLSTFSLPDKSQLYQTIRNFLSDSSYKLGGQFSDAVKKQLDMWEVPFRQPHDHQKQEQLKARKQQIDKIKAQWLKRVKKKKWGQQEQKQMIKEFKQKVGKKLTQQILNKFDNFQQKAQYIKTQKVIQKGIQLFNPQKYFNFLERLKTVKQQPLEGKKVLLKFHLKLKDNCLEGLKKLQQYLIKKQQQHKKLQQQKLQGNAQKKKKTTKKKGKNQKQQQEQKPLVFDFLQILDEQNWNGVVQTFKIILQKSPFLILIGCTYGPRLGRFQQKFSTKFLLEHFKTIQPSIQFMDHQNLNSIGEKLQNQTISEGSMFLLQNLNFMSCQTLICEQINIQSNQEAKQQSKIKVTKRNVLYPQIRNHLDKWVLKGIDIIVDQDRFNQKASGISTYSRKQVVLGSYWWNYIGLSIRAKNQIVIIGGDLNPKSLLFLYRLGTYCKQIFLTSLIGLKFKLAIENKKELCGVTINQAQLKLIRQLIYQAGSKENLSNFGKKVIAPQTFKFLKTTKQQGQENSQKNQIFDFHFSQENLQMNFQNCKIIDIGQDIPNKISSIQAGHIFMFQMSQIQKMHQKDNIESSTITILKNLYKRQQSKRSRHAIQTNTPGGVNYQQDIVVYLIGIDSQFIQGIQFKEKKVKKLQNIQGQQGEELQEQPQEQGQQEQGKKKIDLVADYKLSSISCLKKIMCGNFNQGLKNISKYKKPLNL